MLVNSHGCTLWMIVKELSDRGVVKLYSVQCGIRCGIRCAYYVVYGVHVLSGGYLSAVGRLFHRNASQCSFQRRVPASASNIVCS